jgi:hypothetical protein
MSVVEICFRVISTTLDFGFSAPGFVWQVKMDAPKVETETNRAVTAISNFMARVITHCVIKSIRPPHKKSGFVGTNSRQSSISLIISRHQ